jgi:hypothetical protein
VNQLWVEAATVRALKSPAEERLSKVRQAAVGLSTSSHSTDLTREHAEGLFGEIVTELFSQDCFTNFQLIYSNWWFTGRSNARGLDHIGVRKSNSGVEELVLVESKFCGESDDAQSNVRRVLRDAVNSLEDGDRIEMDLSQALVRLVKTSVATSSHNRSLSPIRIVNLLETCPRLNCGAVWAMQALKFEIILASPPNDVLDAQDATSVSLGDLSTISQMVKEKLPLAKSA